MVRIRRATNTSLGLTTTALALGFAAAWCPTASARGPFDAKPSSPAAPAPAPASFAGTYVGEDSSLTLSGGPTQFTGYAVADGTRLSVTATLADGKLRGRAVYRPTSPDEEAEEFAFTAELTADGLIVTDSDGETHRLKRQGAPEAAAPAKRGFLGRAKSSFAPAPQPAATPGQPAPGGAAPAPTPVPSAPAVLSGERATFVWPLGLELAYPKEWTLSADDNTLVFTPPGGGEATELYMLDFQPAPDLQDVNDPSVVAHMDEVARQLHPGVKRLGEPSRVALASGAAGIKLSYAVEDPAIDARLDCYILLHRGVGYCFSHAGKRQRVEAAAAATAETFAAIKLGEPVRDPVLVGTWRRSVSASGGPSNPGYSYYSERNVTLSADGRVSEESGTSVQGSGAGAYGEGKNNDAARWFAAGGVLVIVMPDGETIPYGYKEGGGGLELTPAGGKTQVWFKVQ